LGNQSGWFAVGQCHFKERYHRRAANNKSMLPSPHISRTANPPPYSTIRRTQL
jgi:hypothetical protein